MGEILLSTLLSLFTLTAGETETCEEVTHLLSRSAFYLRILEPSISSSPSPPNQKTARAPRIPGPEFLQVSPESRCSSQVFPELQLPNDEPRGGGRRGGTLLRWRLAPGMRCPGRLQPELPAGGLFSARAQETGHWAVGLFPTAESRAGVGSRLLSWSYFFLNRLSALDNCSGSSPVLRGDSLAWRPPTVPRGSLCPHSLLSPFPCLLR